MAMEGLLTILPDHVKPVLQEFREILLKMAVKKEVPVFETTSWRGYRFPLAFSSEAAEKVYEKHDFEENSVIISSFPKTGTNWIVEIARQIHYGHDKNLTALLEAIPVQLSVLEYLNAEKLEIMKYLPLSRKVYATHLPAELINMEKVKKSNSKVIVPVRNPKDQAVSWYHFSQAEAFKQIREDLSPEWSKFFADFVEGKQPVPVTKPGEGYAEFLLQWYKRRNDGNVLFVNFEDLKTNTENGIRRMAEFLDVKLTDELISHIVQRTSLSAMKKSQEKSDSEQAKLRKALNLVRKGGVGSWKDYFTVAQSELMDKMMDEKLAGTDIKFTYE